MAKQVQVIRGMHDILPADMPVWNQLEDTYRALAESYGYRQIRTPIVERTALFHRGIGEVTDLPHKPVKIETEAKVRILKVKLKNGDKVTLPRANVELIEE